MRWSLAIMAALLVLVVAACGGQPAASSGNGDGGNGGDGGSSTAPAASQDDGDGDGSGDFDTDAAYERLIPPNAEEVTKTTAGGVIFAAFNSSDSVDSLTSFYTDAFDDLGLQILTTTETAGGVSWFVGTDENATEFGGVISVIPATDGGSGSTVSVQIGSTNE